MRLLSIVLAIAVAACGDPQTNLVDDRANVLTAIPSEFVGQWAASKEWCFDKDGGNVLQIDDDEVVFQEAQSIGPLLIKRVGSLQIEVETTLSGEGERWNAKLGFLLQNEGETLVQSGYGPEAQDLYVKCPASPQAGRT